ncbi:Rrf2 family transcriptional regulator [Blastochloris sulfoviridis]|uniref:Rrf2 family transcriptional regulator n=1 Tax=Blastochloris sulfoviridis TaxID=50712 RepID=A0A5M6I5Q1_9HYPH|nr:Rrf2 family transcriptional regulator [Blastochloris sulfoviridis]KAA5603544.1 Rrf2 family transcriptional regulator [Blastochloris sulfoviridis]
MKLQIATRHALFAILELASQPDRQMSAAEIADKYALSPNHLAKVLRTLGRAGMVEASRGVGGGYRFCGNAKRMNLLDIIAIFEPIGPNAAGAREAGDDTREGQALRQVLNEIEDSTRATLSSITVDTMLKLVRRTPAPDAAPRKAASAR